MMEERQMMMERSINLALAILNFYLVLGVPKLKIQLLAIVFRKNFNSYQLQECNLQDQGLS